MNHKKLRKDLEQSVKEGRAYCLKHNGEINLREYFAKKCYLPENHRIKYCKYFKIK